MEEDRFDYAGFWVRTAASIVDTILLLMVMLPLAWIWYGDEYFTTTETLIHGPVDFLLSYIAPIAIVLIFWSKMQATPGKMMISSKIVDATTGGVPTTGQLVIRYLGYIPSTLVLGLGLIWVAFDRRKQGWHDKMAGTVVVRKVAPKEFTFNQ